MSLSLKKNFTNYNKTSTLRFRALKPFAEPFDVSNVIIEVDVN